MDSLRYVLRGCGYLEGYGEHPGTAPLCVLVLMGGLAGVQTGLVNAVMGAGAMLAVFGPMYLCGAYGRGKDAAASKLRTPPSASQVPGNANKTHPEGEG